MQFGIFDDSHISNFFPLTYSRAFFHIRTGFYTQIQFLESVLGQSVTFHKTLPHLSDYYSAKTPYFNSSSTQSDCVFINSRIRNFTEILPDLNHLKASGDSLINGNEVIAIKINQSEISGFIGSSEIESFVKNRILVDHKTFQHTWEIILSNNETMFVQKTNFLGSKLFSDASTSYQAQIIGEGKVFVGKNVTIHPLVSFDCRGGDIVIDDGAEIMSHSALVAPCYVGEKTKIKIGAKIYQNCVIGPVCKIGGELEDVVIQGHSNKQHDGFLGHAFLGEWCNLGADTNNSDLKNTYASVDLWENGKMTDTGSQFMGSVFGDHSKTGINTQLNTGTVVGFSCNVYGAGFPERFIPTYHWSADGRLVEYRLSKAKETAKIVMSRRNIEFTEADSKLFDDIKALSAFELQSIKKKNIQ